MRCEEIIHHPDYRRLDSIKAIAIDLRYAGVNNCFGIDLYGELDCAWLHKEAAAALEQSCLWLSEHFPSLRILVFDALRPHRVQEWLWRHLEGTPEQRYIADPARGSIHSFGMALDLSLIDVAGDQLDMGTGFDDLREASHPVLEQKMLAAGVIQTVHIANREILRQAMQAGGFVGINSEWWHFNCGDQQLVRETYLRVD